MRFGYELRCFRVSGDFPRGPSGTLGNDMGDLAQDDHRVIRAALASQQPLAVRKRAHVA